MTTPSLQFQGVAHPPPEQCNKHEADLKGAEMDIVKLGDTETPLLVEHTGRAVGHVEHSWRGPRGELLVGGRVDDPVAAERVRSGNMRGLSLGMSVIDCERNGNAENKDRFVNELSLCERPARGGCYINTIDGKRVLRQANFASGMRYKPPLAANRQRDPCRPLYQRSPSVNSPD